MDRSLLLVAAGGLAREVAESARRAGWEVLGCLDDNATLAGTEVLPGLAVLGGLDVLSRFPRACLAVCAGKGSARQAIVQRLVALGVDECRYPALVDPSVTVPPSCTVGVGSVLLAGTVLTASVTVGRYVACMPQVVLTHDDMVSDYATLCAGATFGGSVVVGPRAYVGMASSVREGVRLGADCILGMGAVLLTDVPIAQTWGGAPARMLAARASSDPS